MKVFKRNAVIITVVLFVCAAVYLNWSYNKDETDTQTMADKNTVNTEVESENASADNETKDSNDAGLYYESGEQETVNTNDEYFAEARLTRQQARDEATQTFKTIAAADGAAQETVDDALQNIAKVAEWSMEEAELESLIMAKGFTDCVVFMSDDGVKVTVPTSADGLSSASIAKITDIITEETEFTAADLKIIEIK